MWARLLLWGVLLSASAGAAAAGGGPSRPPPRGAVEELFAVPASRPPPGFCELPPDQQQCTNNVSIRIYYNSQAGVCEKFLYRGCEGNRNNFATQLECLQTCASPGICQLPRDAGFGDAIRSRFFYNPVSRTCERFLYKGSRGNANNFWDGETCIRFCAPHGRPGSCPTVRPGTVGTCANECQSDDGCPEGRKCCFNGCGRTCKVPVLEKP